MNVAVYHHLPTGGALRVVAEWLRHTGAETVTVYTPDPAVHTFADFPADARVVTVPAPGPYVGVGALAGLLRAEGAGKQAAATIDAAGHDVVLVLPSRLTQAPTVLSHLRTPALFYAPEAMRSAYEDPRLVFFGDDWRNRVTRAGVNPIELLRRAIDRRSARAARHVVTHSEFTREDLRRAYGIEATVVRLGVDIDAFTPAAAEELDGASPFVLSVGAFHPLKGHDLVVDAIGRVPHERRPRLTIVGDRGQIAAELDARAARLGVELDLRHSIPFPEIVTLMRTATVVACAQIREPFGLVPLEAMASGRPVVAVADGGLRESVRDGETGLLVARDPQAMATAIDRLLADPPLRARFGAAGRADVEANWRWERCAHDLDEHLRARVAAPDARAEQRS